MTKRDWLDDVLRSRPVDDEGFSARVTGLGRGEARTWWTVRVTIAVVVVAAVAACSGVEMALIDAVFGSGNSIDAEAWLRERRPGVAGVVADFDALPALRRRSGRDATAVLDPVFERFRNTEAMSADDRASCAHELATSSLGTTMSLRSDDVEKRALSTCDTSWIVGLAGYDQWTPSRYPGVNWGVLASIARTHLRRAAAQPVVDGAPAPFAVAARDVEALGRLVLTRSSVGAWFFDVVASEHEAAARAGRAGDHVVVIDADGARRIQIAWRVLGAYTSGGASDDDVAFVGRLQSVLACGALADGIGLHAREAQFLDDHALQRLRSLDGSSCARPPVTTVNDEDICYGMTPGFCRLVLAPTSFPPFRQHVVRALQGWWMPDIPASRLEPSTKKPVQP